MSNRSITCSNSLMAFDWKFLGLFIVYTGLLVLPGHNIDPFRYALMEQTASLAALFWNFISVPARHIGSYIVIIGFQMDVILECTAYDYMALFLAAIFAWRGHSLSYKIYGSILGITLIFLLNLLRIGIIGLVGHYYPAIFEFVHLYLWQGLFAIAVLLVFFLWAAGNPSLHLNIGVKTALSVALTLPLFWLIMKYNMYYTSFMAAVANIIFPVLSPIMDVPLYITASGRHIVYGVDQTQIVRSDVVMINVLNSIFFIVLTHKCPTVK